MRVQVAWYRLGSGTISDLASRIEEGNLPVIRGISGFVSYHAFDTADGIVASVLVFDDQSGFEEAEQRLAGWIERTTEEFTVEPLGILEGDVFASTSRPG